MRSNLVTLPIEKDTLQRYISEFYKSVLLNGITLICIESHETVLLENEHRVIIDQDLCII